MTLLPALLLLAAAPDAAVRETPIRVLLVTGVDYPGHLWKETTPALLRVFKGDPRFAVDVAETPDVLGEEKIFAYDVLFLHFKNYDPLKNEEQAKRHLAKFLEQGKGIALFHFACGALPNWPQFVEIAGRVWDQKTGHDPRGPFTVRIVAPEHPLVAGMRDFAADDELYTCLVGSTKIETLAVARSKVTGADHPMAFVLRHGAGRVFHSPLGHDVKAIEMPGVAELVRRGTAWAAGRTPIAR